MYSLKDAVWLVSYKFFNFILFTIEAIFVILKLVGVIKWKWMITLIPLWIVIIVWLVLAIGAFIVLIRTGKEL